ncbi:hypothetical protein Btru_010118 [Bulinus truncatus]|nr:hypothetical protein Btru_010118 [Bulinus truncatus]
MAAFIAKQVVGDKLSSVKGAIGKDEEGGTNEKDDEEAREIEEARREMEEKRKEKHRKMEEERETMRQGIRDKFRKPEVVLTYNSEFHEFSCLNVWLSSGQMTIEDKTFIRSYDH